MADRETWAKRVAEWRASGLSSLAFCAGKEFTAGGLRHWAHRLRHGEQKAPSAIRVARVVRVREERQAGRTREFEDGITVEIGPARITLRPGFDRATLGAILEVLAAAAARSAR